MEREVSEVDRKLLLKKTYLDKINYHITRNPINQEELYPIVRHFFSEYLKLDYEFTYEELSQELNKVFIRPKVKEHIDDFLIRLSESEYLEEDALGSKEINAFLSELADIIMNIISEEQAAIKEDDSLITKILKKKQSATKVIDIAGMNSLIDELNFHITSGNLDSSKRLYVDLLKTYDDMSKADKKTLHEPMNEVYDRLQSLMKNPKGAVNAQQQDAQSLSASADAKKVLSMAEDVSFYINALNTVAAKKTYTDALKLYESLDTDEKKVLHPQLTELYNRLQKLSSRPSAADAVRADVLRTDPANVPVVQTTDISANASKSEQISSSDERYRKTDIYPSLKGSISTSGTSDDSDISKAIAPESISEPALEPVGMASAAQATSADGPDVSADSNHNLNLIGDSGEALRREGVREGIDITSAGNTFDYSIDESSKDASSAADEDIDVYRKPLMDDGSKKSEIDSMIRGGFDDAVPYDAKDDMSGNAKNKTAFEKSDKRSDKSKSKPSLPAPAGPATYPDKDISFDKSNTSNVLFTIGQPEGQQTEQQIGQQTEPQVGQQVGQRKMSFVEEEVMQKTMPQVSMVSMTPIAPITAAPLTLPPMLVAQVYDPDVASLQRSRTVESLSSLLNNINDDMVLERFDKAKEEYKEALVIYRTMNDEEKASCYERFHSTFRDLDAALHQRSLHRLLETHLSESLASNRAVASRNIRETAPYIPESNVLSSRTTLPMMISADEATVRVYELIEESYFNLDKNNCEIAMLKYFKALELYRNLPSADKKRSYRDLHNLFKKLSLMKSAFSSV